MSTLSTAKLVLAALVASFLTACGGGGGGGEIKFSDPVDTQTPQFMSSGVSIETISRIPFAPSPTQTLAVVNVIEALPDYSTKTRYQVAVDGLFYETNNIQLNDAVKAKIKSLTKPIHGIYNSSSIEGMSSSGSPASTLVSSVLSIYGIENGVSKIEKYSGFDVYPRIFNSTLDPLLTASIENIMKNIQPQLMKNYVGFDVIYTSEFTPLGFGSQKYESKTLVEVCLWKVDTLNVKRCDFVRLAFSGSQPKSSDSDFKSFIGQRINALSLNL